MSPYQRHQKSTNSVENFVSITIGFSDLAKIQKLTKLAVVNHDTFLELGNGAISDHEGHPTEAVTQKCNIFAKDDTRPTVDNYSLDLNQDVLHLSFSEVVKTSSFQHGGLTLQDGARKSTDAGRVSSYTIKGGALTSQLNSHVLSIRLPSSDVKLIKRYSSIATGEDNTFLVIKAGIVTDMAGNEILAVSDGNAIKIQIGGYARDQTKPRLESFNVVMSEEGPPLKLRMKFSEVMDITSMKVSGRFRLQDSEVCDNDSCKRHTLNGGDAQALHD